MFIIYEHALALRQYTLQQSHKHTLTSGLRYFKASCPSLCLNLFCVKTNNRKYTGGKQTLVQCVITTVVQNTTMKPCTNDYFYETHT